jgi:hypothetical protein
MVAIVQSVEIAVVCIITKNKNEIPDSYIHFIIV